MISFRSIVITSVIGCSAAGALWLIRDPALLSPVPAQVVARDFKIAAVETGRLATVLAAPGQNCAQPGQDRVNGSWARVMLQADTVRALEDGGATRVAVLSTGVDRGQPQLDDHPGILGRCRDGRRHHQQP